MSADNMASARDTGFGSPAHSNDVLPHEKRDRADVDEGERKEAGPENDA